MKVLHVGKFFPPHHGGMETHLAVLAAGLRPFVDVEVAVAAGDRPSGHEVVGGVRLRRLRTLGMVAATPMCPDLFRVIREVRPDLVHVHHPHPLAMLAYLASAPATPCVVTYHSDIVRQKVLRRLIAPVVRETLRRSAAIIVASPPVMERSAALRPFRHKCHLVPYGMDTSARDRVDPRRVADLRRRHGPRIVLAVGRLTLYKGFEHLVRAMRTVEATLLIAGDGALRARLERLVDAEGVRSRVVLLGAVPDVLPYYEACDLFVLPSISRNEAFGLVQLEAMAAGKPIVNTSVDSGVTYACPPDVAGLTVPPGDVPALAEAMRRILDDPALARRLGENGRRRAAEGFGVDAMVAGTLAVYRSVVGDLGGVETSAARAAGVPA